MPDDPSAPLTMEMFGATGGDGMNPLALPDDSQAWNRMIGKAHRTGRPIRLDGRTYRIPGAKRQTLARNHVTITGQPGTVLIGGRNTILFRPDRHGLTFHNIQTRLICLMRAGGVRDNIDRIDIRNWTFDNGIDQEIDFSRPPHSHLHLDEIDTMARPMEAARIHIKPQNSETATRRIRNLVLRNIRGRGGLGGLCFSCAIENVDIDRYEVRDITVPFLTPDGPETAAGVAAKNRKFNDLHYNGDHMLNAGFADGLLLGANSRVAQSICKNWSIRRVKVHGVRDNRQQRNRGRVASCDGVRLLTRGAIVGQVDIRNVSSHYRTDTTGAYFKARDTQVESLLIRNSGGHEAGCVIKGAVRRDGSDKAEGFNITIDTLTLSANDNVPRCALYLAPDHVRINKLSIRGYGGHVIDEHARRIKGAGALIYCENTDKSGLHIGQYSIRNCAVGNFLQAGGRQTGTVNLFHIQGYDDVRIGPGLIDGVRNNRNARAIARQQNTSPANTLPDISIFDWTSVRGKTINRLEIGPVDARNFSVGRRAVTLFALRGKARLHDFIAPSPIVDATVSRGLIANNAPDIGRVRIKGGDLTACRGPRLRLHPTSGPDVEISNCRGL